MLETTEVTVTQVTHELIKELEKEGFRDISTTNRSADGVGDQVSGPDEPTTVRDPQYTAS